MCDRANEVIGSGAYSVATVKIPSAVVVESDINIDGRRGREQSQSHCFDRPDRPLMRPAAGIGGGQAVHGADIVGSSCVIGQRRSYLRVAIEPVTRDPCLALAEKGWIDGIAVNFPEADMERKGDVVGELRREKPGHRIDIRDKSCW